MKCPKCRYTSFPHLENCPKCGFVLSEQRAAVGLYALQPDPPDLGLAFQARSMEIAGGLHTAPVSAPGFDLGPLEGIDLEDSEVEPSGAETAELEESTNAPDGPDSDRFSNRDMIISQGLDSHQLGDITLALEHDGNLEEASPPSIHNPDECTEVKQVYDLDVDEELDGLILGPIVDDADEDDTEAVEVTLEIEEDLEFEVERLELEQDEEGEDEDDDDR